MKCNMDCLNCQLEKCIHDVGTRGRINHVVSGMTVGLANRLSLTLVRQNVRQNELSSLTGISEPTISAYVNGIRKPRADHIVAICKALHISSDWLLGIK